METAPQQLSSHLTTHSCFPRHFCTSSMLILSHSGGLNSSPVPVRGNLAMSMWEHRDQAAAARLGHANSSPDPPSLQTPPS